MKGKKAVEMAGSIIIVLGMLIATFIVWKFGILDKMTGMVYSIGYQVDTTQVESCRAIMEKHTGATWTSETFGGQKSYIPTDNDEDRLPDYICDPCICRDPIVGKDSGTACGRLQENTGEYKKCYRQDGNDIEGEGDSSGSCGTNSYNVIKDDPDSDFIPNVCDYQPNKYNEKTKRCFEGDIFDNKGRLVGYVEKSTDLENSAFKWQCIFRLCMADGEGQGIAYISDSQSKQQFKHFEECQKKAEDVGFAFFYKSTDGFFGPEKEDSNPTILTLEQAKTKVNG